MLQSIRRTINSRSGDLLKKIAFRSMATAASPKQIMLSEREEFKEIFRKESEDIISEVHKIQVPELSNRYRDLMRYNIETCEVRAGLAMVHSYKILETPKHLTEEKLKLANIMGICVQLLGNAFLVLDDLMDCTDFRYDKPCWHKHEDISISVAIDQIFLESCIYHLLEKHFSNHPCYKPIHKFLQKMTFQMALGQTLDAMLPNLTRRNLEQLTMANFTKAAELKNGWYCIYAPMGSALTLANIHDEELHRQARDFCMAIGVFDQVINDYFDCFGSEEVTGKNASDISVGKCSWLAARAMEKANAMQKKIMQEHYGRDNPESVQRIRRLYEELDLTGDYNDYIAEFPGRIYAQIEEISPELPKKMFVKIAEQFIDPNRSLGI